MSTPLPLPELNTLSAKQSKAKPLMNVSAKQMEVSPAVILAPKCTFAVQREKTWLDGRVLYEYVPEPNRFRAMKLLPQELIEERKETHLENLKTKNVKKMHFNSIKEQNEIYYRHLRRDTKIKKVILNRAKHGWGRVIADDSSTFACLERFSRNTLLDDHHLDVDIKNCQANIILNAATDEGEEMPALSEFCEMRDEILEKATHEYKKTKDEIKKVWTSLMNGGKIPKWYKNSLAHKVAEECRVVRAIIKQRNPELYESMRQKTMNDPEKMVKYGGELEGIAEAALRSMMSMWFQHHEVRIVSAVLEWCHKEGLLTLEGDAYKDKVILGYIYDGFVLAKCIVDKWSQRTGKTVADMTRKMQEVAYEQTGFTPTWTVKPFEQKFDISEQMIAVMAAPVQSEAKRLTGDMGYTQMEEEFEKTNCKIYNSGLFVQTNADGTHSIRTEEKLRTQNKHLWAGYDDKGQPQNFIQKWLVNNTNIRMYDKMDVYPNPVKCPLDTYNLWVPFAMERVEEFQYDDEGLQFFLDFIKHVICGHPEHHTVTPQYDYMIKWLAHLLQKPDKKVGKCPILISGFGSGKGTLIEIMQRIMGRKKVFESPNPARDVFGDFNPLMEEAMLVVLDEPNGKINAEAQETMKNLITGGQLTINQKHVPAFTITSRHSFMVTANPKGDGGGGIQVPEGDRRYFVLRCSDHKKHEVAYWNKWRSYLDNDEEVDLWKTIYDWLMVQDLTGDWLPHTPKTEYQKNLEASTKTAIDCWMEDMVMTWKQNMMKGDTQCEKKKAGEEWFRDYASYCERNGYKGKEAYTNAGGLSGRISNHPISNWGGKKDQPDWKATQIMRGGGCNHRVFRFNEMWNYYVHSGIFKEEDFIADDAGGNGNDDAPAENLPPMAAPVMIEKRKIVIKNPIKFGVIPNDTRKSLTESAVSIKKHEDTKKAAAGGSAVPVFSEDGVEQCD